MYQLSFHVPATHVELVKEAIFATGAGRIDNYTHCAWQVLGEGQFMPLPGSNPFLGNANTLEKVSEYKVELICEAEHIHAAIKALKQAHPYEVPSYQVIKLENL